MGSICYRPSFYSSSSSYPSFQLLFVMLLPSIQLLHASSSYPRSCLPSNSYPPSIQLLSAVQLRPAIRLVPVIQHPTTIQLPSTIQLPPSSSCLLSSASTLSLCQGFSFSSRLIVLAEVAREEEVGSSDVGSSGKINLSEKVVLVLLVVKAGDIKEGSGFLPSRQVLGRAIKACSRSCHQGVCRQGEFGILP